MAASLAISTSHRAEPAFDDCAFYHSMTIPGHGNVTGEWDLRGREREYLGNIDLTGKESSRDRDGERSSLLLDGESGGRRHRL